MRCSTYKLGFGWFVPELCFLDAGAKNKNVQGKEKYLLLVLTSQQLSLVSASGPCKKENKTTTTTMMMIMMHRKLNTAFSLIIFFCFIYRSRNYEAHCNIIILLAAGSDWMVWYQALREKVCALCPVCPQNHLSVRCSEIFGTHWASYLEVN